MRRPCVYVWLRGDEVLYVGKGANGMNRPLDPLHHRIRNGEIRERDRLMVYECKPGEEQKFEKTLIATLKPKLNGGNPDPVEGLTSIDQLAAKLRLAKGTLYNWTGRLGAEQGAIGLGNRTLIDWSLFWKWPTSQKAASSETHLKQTAGVSVEPRE